MPTPRTSAVEAQAQTSPAAWARIWILALILFAFAVLGAELAWRALGYHPTVSDSPERWSVWYEHVCNRETNSIALIGSSRMQAGISAEQLRRRLPGYRVSQLGRNGGGSPVGVLRALADDQRFRGIVICDMLTPFLPRTEWNKQGTSDAAEGSLGWTARFDRRASSFLSDAFAIKNHQTGLIASAKAYLQSGSAPARRRVRIHADRALIIDFEMISDLKAYAAERTDRYRVKYEDAVHPTPEELDDEVQVINALVSKIRSRGGQVVFARIPTSGAMRTLEESYHPRAAYWDRFASIGSEGQWIHDTDLAVAATTTCPDESHLDEEGANRFTDSLVDELITRQVFVEKGVSQN